jgi:hypothetical protein
VRGLGAGGGRRFLDGSCENRDFGEVGEGYGGMKDGVVGGMAGGSE